MPNKIVSYECTVCNTLYEHWEEALICEERHLIDGKDDDFKRIDLDRIYNMIESRGNDPCDYCKHSFYAYGYEQECAFRNNGKCLGYGKSKGKSFSPKTTHIMNKFVKARKEEEQDGIEW